MRSRTRKTAGPVVPADQIKPQSWSSPLDLDIKLTHSEVTRAFSTPENPYGPILSLNEAAALAKLAPGTLKRLVSEGRFAGSVKRGKPLLFWRDRFVAELMK